MNGHKTTRILVAPLDWGLGHATRCIPLIKAFQQQGCEVVLAADGAVATLLSVEFPAIRIVPLQGYGIRYSGGSSLFGSMLRQLPGILRSINYEHQWLNSLLQQEQFDLIISDNRPGFWNKQVPCIYITHQLLIHSGKGKWLNRLLQQQHSRYMKHFTDVWVPDVAANQNLAGELSHPSKPIIAATYVGLLSRLEPTTVASKYELMVLLSGPEPQRSILETKLLDQLQSFKGTVLFVRGLPNHTTTLNTNANITAYNHLPANQLQEAIASAKLIICRSGYTTLMDLTRLQKKAILIPTPGQPEQEYLAAYMQQQSIFPFFSQQEFELANAVGIADSFPYKQLFTDAAFHLHEEIIASTVQQLAKA
jgi:uncharacterized protein (TIGR00661 family)